MNKQTTQEILAKMATRNGLLNGFPTVNSVIASVDGNMTVVVVNDKYVGWAKYNPKDTRILYKPDRDGLFSPHLQNKYSERAGLLKATHRALKKLLNAEVPCTKTP